MESINERVSSLIKATGLSTNAFAKKLGKPQSSVAIIADGRSKPGFELLELICSTYPEVSTDWLLMGDGEMYKESKPTNPEGKQDGYLHDHLRVLEDKFTKLAHQLEMKDQQIAGLQRTVDALVGKSEGATDNPLSFDEFKDEMMYHYYTQAVYKNLIIPMVPSFQLGIRD